MVRTRRVLKMVALVEKHHSAGQTRFQTARTRLEGREARMAEARRQLVTLLAEVAGPASLAEAGLARVAELRLPLGELPATPRVLVECWTGARQTVLEERVGRMVATLLRVTGLVN